MKKNKKNRTRFARTNPIKAYIRNICREEICHAGKESNILRKTDQLSKKLTELEKRKIRTWEFGTITCEEAYRKIMVEIARLKREMNEIMQRDT